MKFDQMVCEHEAAHAVVARSFGVTVSEIRADNPTAGVAGVCSFDSAAWFRADRWGGMSLERMATSKAAELWITRCRRDVFANPGGFRSDRMSVGVVLDEAMPHGVEARFDYIRRAEKLALEVLAERRDDLLVIAGKLQRHGRWTLGRGWGAPPAVPSPRRAVRPAAPRVVPSAPRSRVVTRGGRPVELFAELRGRVTRRELSPYDADRILLQAGHRIRSRVS